MQQAQILKLHENCSRRGLGAEIAQYGCGKCVGAEGPTHFIHLYCAVSAPRPPSGHKLVVRNFETFDFIFSLFTGLVTWVSDQLQPYEFVGSWTVYVPKAYEFMWSGDIHGLNAVMS